MANLQASGGGNVYDPRVSRNRNIWFKLEAEGKKLRAERDRQRGKTVEFYNQMRGNKLKEFKHEP